MIDKRMCVLTDPRNLANFNLKAQQTGTPLNEGTDENLILNRRRPADSEARISPQKAPNDRYSDFRDNRGKTTYHDINPVAQIYEGGSEVRVPGGDHSTHSH